MFYLHLSAFGISFTNVFCLYFVIGYVCQNKTINNDKDNRHFMNKT